MITTILLMMGLVYAGYCGFVWAGGAAYAVKTHTANLRIVLLGAFGCELVLLAFVAGMWRVI